MDNRPIGVFDSGLGGLTAVKELRAVLPHENILYFGDTGRVPYGTRSPETIRKYTRQDIRFLLENDVKAIVAACGTVSSAARSELTNLPVPCVNVIEPTAEAAENATLNGRVGVIATAATVKSDVFRRILLELDGTMKIYQESCPLLVPLVENGYIAPDEQVTRLVLERYLAPLIKNRIDTLILGCTHYPILEPIIASVMGEDVVLINSGRETARHCARILQEKDLLRDVGSPGECSYFVSDSVQGFREIANIFLGADMVGTVARLDIDRY